MVARSLYCVSEEQKNDTKFPEWELSTRGHIAVSGGQACGQQHGKSGKNWKKGSGTTTDAPIRTYKH
eukprot:366508-Chlamydomonas_euryale.AAC.10